MSKEKEERVSYVEWGDGEGANESRLTTTSIIMLPFAPAKPLPPKEYTSCEMMTLQNKEKTRWDISYFQLKSTLGLAGQR